MSKELNLSAITGLTVFAQLYNKNAGNPQGLPIPINEIGDSGEYTGDVPLGTPAAIYVVSFRDAFSKIAGGELEWDGTREIIGPDFDIAAAQLDEIHKIHGLQPAAPLNVTDTSRQAGDISQTIVEAGPTVTVTRV